MSDSLADRMADLAARRVPFVHATVVRAEQPTSARPGDSAVILPDGRLEGFVGGHCSRESVRTAALSTLDTGESLLLRVLPGDASDFPETPGAKVTVNPCLSGGAVEIFLEPHLPPAIVTVMGTTPIAAALDEIGTTLGLAMRLAAPDDNPAGATAVVICTLGDGDETAIRSALDAGVEFIALVASAKRGDAVLDSLGLTPEERERIHTPAGLHIGATTPAEIALSILAQLVQALRVEGLAPRVEKASPAPEQATDPICGMSVVILPETPHLRIADEDFWFCNPACRDEFARQRTGG